MSYRGLSDSLDQKGVISGRRVKVSWLLVKKYLFCRFILDDSSPLVQGTASIKKGQSHKCAEPRSHDNEEPLLKPLLRIQNRPSENGALFRSETKGTTFLELTLPGRETPHEVEDGHSYTPNSP